MVLGFYYLLQGFVGKGGVVDCVGQSVSLLFFGGLVFGSFLCGVFGLLYGEEFVYCVVEVVVDDDVVEVMGGLNFVVGVGQVFFDVFGGFGGVVCEMVV